MLINWVHISNLLSQKSLETIFVCLGKKNANNELAFSFATNAWNFAQRETEEKAMG